MIILTITLSLMLIALTLRYGRPGLVRLAHLQLKSGWMALLALLAQLVSITTHQYRLELLLVSAVLLIAFCWRNARHAGITLAACGIALNMLVMALNGGMMPVRPDNVAQVSGFEFDSGSTFHFSKSIVLQDDQATLHWLTDRLLLPGPLARFAVWSIGDVLMLLGVGWLLWRTMKGDHRATDGPFDSPRATSSS